MMVHHPDAADDDCSFIGRPRRLAALARLLVLSILCGSTGALPTAAGQSALQDRLDTALVVSVDVSNSVDEHRYKLQMEGIAAALEDPAVINAILNGPNGGILFSMVSWADRPQVAVPWVKITSKADAMAVATKVRMLPRHGGEFTCLSRMMRFVSDKIVTQMPQKTLRVVLDVSGDGSDNCNPEEPASAVRDELVGTGATINGLPILEGKEAKTLEPWYRDNVMGGPGAFVLPAEGFNDFGRAIRQKFVVEISAAADNKTVGLR